MTVPLPERPSVAVAFMLAVGSRYETDEQSGISHFFEHMVFKGTASYRTPKAISEAIEGVGGVLDAATDRETTVFWTRVPKTQLPLAIDVLADMLLRPLLSDDEVRKERRVVIEELRMYQDNPQEYASIIFDELMWPDSPLGSDVAGRVETVSTFTADDCRTHMQAHVRPETLLVSVAGGVETEEVVEHLRARLDGWASQARNGRPAATPAPDSAGGPVRLARRSVEQATVMIGARASSYFDADRFAMELLNVVLGEGMSSRLFLELRERRGVVYDVHSFISRFWDSGVLGISLGCDPARTPSAIRAAIAEVRRLAAEPLDAHELRKAREYAKGRLLLHLEGTAALCEYAGQQQLLTGQILNPQEVAARYDAVSPADVQQAAQRVLQSGMRCAVVGPFNAASRFEAALS